jgi:nucleotide-binding universal stress UspA family protein
MSDRAPVLVAVNFTPHSDEALRQAHAWAQARDEPLIACHVAPWATQGYLASPPVAEQISDEARLAELLDERVREVTGRPSEAFEVAVEVGAPYAEIVRRAEASGVQLVVVGGHTHSRFADLLLGDVTEYVVRHAACSVLVARAHEATRRIVVGTDLSARAAVALEAAVEQARHLLGHVFLVHSLGELFGRETVRGMIADWDLMPIERELPNPERLEAQRRLALQLARYRVDGDIDVRGGDPAAAIVDAARTLDADLVVVGATGAGALRRALLGSVTEKVVRTAPCSVLVVRSSSER